MILSHIGIGHDANDDTRAKTHLSRLIKQALAGEEIIIAKRDKPLVKLVPVEPRKSVPRYGGWEGEIWMADDFDEPLDDFKDYMPE